MNNVSLLCKSHPSSITSIFSCRVVANQGDLLVLLQTHLWLTTILKLLKMFWTTKFTYSKRKISLKVQTRIRHRPIRTRSQLIWLWVKAVPTRISSVVSLSFNSNFNLFLLQCFILFQFKLRSIILAALYFSTVFFIILWPDQLLTLL